MERELEENLILHQVLMLADEYNEVVNLQETKPQLFFKVKNIANIEGINYTIWLRNHNIFHVDTARGQMSAKEMKKMLIKYADEDSVIESLKTKNSKLMDNMQTRAMFHKIDVIEFVKKLTNCTLLRRGINESEVLNVRLKKSANDEDIISYENIIKLPVYYKIKSQAYKENLTILEWFNKYTKYKYVGELASKKFSNSELKNKNNKLVKENKPEFYINNVKDKLELIASTNDISSLSDIRKIDKQLANSIRYLQQNYPTGALNSWYDVVEKLGLENKIQPCESVFSNHNIPKEVLEQKLNQMLENNYPNKVVTNIKDNPKLYYLCKKLATYDSITVKEVLKNKNYEFPLGFNTTKRLKSLKIVNKSKNLHSDLKNENLPQNPQTPGLTPNKNK